MDRATVEQYIRTFGAADNEPVLDRGEIELLIDISRRADPLGYVHTDDGWTPSYDTNVAVSRAWEMKAGKAAGAYTFMQGGNQFIRSDMIRHCQQMADRWRRGIYASIQLDGSGGYYASIHPSLLITS